MEYSVNYDYLRPRKAAQLKELHELPLPCRETLNITHIPNGTLLPLKEFENSEYHWGQGGVMDADWNFVEETAFYHFYGAGYPVEKPVTKEGTAVFCGYFKKHWGDFLIICLARLWFALEHDDPSYRYVFLSKDGDDPNIRGNYKELLDLLGIGDRVDVIAEPTRYTEVIIPEASYAGHRFTDHSYYSPEYKKTFDAISANITPDDSYPAPCKKLFMSRSQFGKSRDTEAGMDMLDHYFEKNGFTIIFPEKIRLSHMIYLVQHAEVYASASGTLPHNTLFGPDGQNVIIVERNPVNNEYQYNINRIKKLQTTYIDGNLSVYPVRLAYGPFIYAYTKYFQRFTEDHHYQHADEAYQTDKYYRSLLRQYFHSYKDNLHYLWITDYYTITDNDIISEGYWDSLPYFEDYLMCRRPFQPHHYFSFYYFKPFIKRLIGRA